MEVVWVGWKDFGSSEDVFVTGLNKILVRPVNSHKDS